MHAVQVVRGFTEDNVRENVGIIDSAISDERILFTKIYGEPRAKAGVPAIQ